jgi:hypothetical protein
MYTAQKAGGGAAIALSSLFIALLILLIAVLPSQGFGPGALSDPAVGIPFLEYSILPSVIDFIYIGCAVVLVPILLGLYQRFHSNHVVVMSLAFTAGAIASSLFLAYGMINFIGAPYSVSAYHQNAAVGATLYLTLRTIANAMNAAALFATGWAVVLSGWAIRQTRTTSQALAYLMLLAGGATLISFAFLPIGLLGILLAPIWSLWVGIVLLRMPSSSLMTPVTTPTAS